MTVKKDSATSKKQDSGSSEFQITVFTNRIKNLTEHLKLNKKRSQYKKRINEARWKKKKTFELHKK